MELGLAIKLIRTHIGVTQTDLAEMCEVSQTSLSQIETGSKQPRERTIKRVCKVLEVPESLLYILAMKDEDVPESKKYIYHLVFPMIKDLTWQLVTSAQMELLKP